ncbi:uncharacterized protein LOC110095156 [Dendrobium catenatum]|uniref:cyclic pyranopterin monophosphate synthase n=1 Tax=Dendrobium catenatum TaxID=906689 RepID=A0A2I0W684_9ASPA|nr:uncharacterized protein LOC110095156 [Dendrobium catenatum]PKU71160.1 Cyclic pyranopterin monophosphate synthase accessory protein, mitochondrial [Dendrobium catenatum]
MAMIFLRQIRAGCSSRRFLSSSSSKLDLAIADLNREMESIFGEPPTQSSIHGELPSTSAINTSTAPDYPVLPECKKGLSHVDNSGNALMVDISSKEDTKRSAIASCRVLLGKLAFNLVEANQIVKGDVLNVAKIAGIQGAKQTSNLIPLCHNINLTRVDLNFVLNKEDFSVEIVGEAATTSKTGVEMEAMTAVAVAGLTVYDMCKAVTKEIQITNVCLEQKSGGKSGSWSRKLSSVSDDDCI